MANARQRFWHRAGPAAAITVGALLIAAAAPGCDDGETTQAGGAGGTGASTNTGATTNTGGTGTAGNGGTGAGTSMGGTGGTGGTGGHMLNCVDPAGDPDPVKIADAFSALDSTPDSAGENIYFTGHNGAANSEGEAGIYGADDNGNITNIYVGDPIASPVGISISSDDKALFVADTATDVTAGDPDSLRGAIFTLGTAADSTPTIVAGTAGYRPRGVDVVPDKDGNDVVYFTGSDPSANPPTPGVYFVPATGGTVEKVANGAVFEDPSGVAVGADNDGNGVPDNIFVTDALGTGKSQSNIIRIIEGDAAEFLPAVNVGYPAGIALSCDETKLFVSGIDPVTHSDVILIIDISTKAVTSFSNATLALNGDPGGLHRARKAPVYSWTDLTAGNGGAVYKVSIK